MKIKFIILIALIFFTKNLYSQNANIIVSGNERYDKQTIIVYGEINPQISYDKNDINDFLKNLYSTNFFENVKITFENNTLKINVKEYPIISNINIEGEKTNKFKELLLERISSKEKGPFIKDVLEKDISNVKSLYEFLGFNRAEIDAKFKEMSNNQVEVFFFVNKGERLKITEIQFIGDKKIRDKRLRDVIASEENKFWKFLTRNTILNNKNIELDKRLLSNYYKSIGYYDVKVLSESVTIDEEGVKLIYNISAGQRYRVNKISTNIDDALEKNVFFEINKEFKKVIGDYYSPFKVKSILDELDVIINSNDLQFVQHSVNEIVSAEGIELKINIFEGEKNTVERVNIFGNTVTNEDVIRAELLLDEGDPFNKLKLDQSLSELRARGIFSKVDAKVKSGSEKDLKIIDITVEEKPTGEITAGAGVGSDGSTVAFGVKENNWLGSGIQLSSFLEVDESKVRGELRFSNPNFDYTGNALGFNIGAVTNDQSEDSGYKNNTISFGTSIDFEQYRNIFIRPGISFVSDDLTVDSTASNLLKKQAGTYNELAFDYAIRRDERNRAYMPTKGYVTSFYQSVPLASDNASIKNVFTLSNYKSFGENLVGTFKFYGAAVNSLDDSNDVRISKRINVPTNRLRGFKRNKVGPVDGTDYVGGNYVSAVNFEALLPNFLPNSTNADVSLFLDFANVWGVDYSDVLDDSDKVRSSTGIFTNWLSPIGPLSFTLSTHLSKKSTDQTQGFKFNLGTTF